MLTNEKFKLKREISVIKKEQGTSNMKKYSRYCCVKTISRYNKIKINEGWRVKVIIEAEAEEDFYRSQYIIYNVNSAVTIRKRNFREYYCINDIELNELKDIEFKQMLESYYRWKKNTRKAFIMFLKSYVIVDENLLMRLIRITSTTKQQVYKKKTILKRFREENKLGIHNLFDELKKITPVEMQRIKEMGEYNKIIGKNKKII